MRPSTEEFREEAVKRYLQSVQSDPSLINLKAFPKQFIEKFERLLEEYRADNENFGDEEQNGEIDISQ